MLLGTDLSSSSQKPQKNKEVEPLPPQPFLFYVAIRLFSSRVLPYPSPEFPLYSPLPLQNSCCQGLTWLKVDGNLNAGPKNADGISPAHVTLVCKIILWRVS